VVFQHVPVQRCQQLIADVTGAAVSAGFVHSCLRQAASLAADVVRRPLKIQQKVSGRLTSDDVTQDRLDIRSYIDTARKHGKNAFAALHDLMTGNPWRPPAQAISP